VAYPARRGELDDGHEDGMLVLEPGPGRGVAGDYVGVPPVGHAVGRLRLPPGLRGRHSIGRGEYRDGLHAEMQVDGGGQRGVQIVVEQPVQRGTPLGLRIVDVGLFGRVGTEQVVEGEPPRGKLVYQVRPGQFGQQAPGARR